MSVSIEGIVSPKLGLASHQNAVPLLRRLVIVNHGTESFADLALELEPDLPFAATKTWRVDRLDAGVELPVADREVELQAGYLAGLTESMQSPIRLRLRCGEEVIAEQHYSVELLARNEWGGSGSMPELLAAFCTPNDPVVDRVLKSASDVLRRAGRPDGMDGYTKKSRERVWELASALWSAICGYQISYVLPPASFEQAGQKIRSPSHVLDGRVGTCLDTALLFAAALEQAGLNPVLLLTKGHAFTGVWLQPQEFAQVLTEDASAVRKRIDLQELVAFETTLATQAPAPGFGRAADVAKRQLTDDDFVMAVDVRRARMQKLRPLSVELARRAEAGGEPSAPRASDGLEAAPELPPFDVEVSEAPATATEKLELWRRKLLDLTTRNRLLHVPESAKVIRLVCPDPARLEDLLAGDASVRIVAMPDLEVGGRDKEIYQQRNRESLEEEAAKQAMARNEVPSRMAKDALDAALVDLYRKGRSDLEEGGSNTLFLAVGFLRWKKAATELKSYVAPLILLPVKLERRSVLSGVKMSMLDDEPQFNMTLLELLRHDFQLTIPELGGDLPTDDSGIDVERIWNVVRRAVRDVPGFEVTPEVMLGTFSFAKYLMWRDLMDRATQLAQNDVVRLLLEGSSVAPSLLASVDVVAPDALDAAVTPGELFTPLPADSSQLAAVVASAKGQSFVLDGPPGTGKSQTIANMIAHNLALGRRVLFVAEKMAALDVVKRRLEDKGIGQFCLELHSSKSSKLHVLQQLDRAWTSRDTLTESDWSAQAQKVRALRDRLNDLVRALHKRWPNGLSVYNAIGLFVKDGDAANPQLSWPSGTQHDAAQMERLRDVARRLDLNRHAADGLCVGMTLVAREEWSNAWQASMTCTANEVRAALNTCLDARAAVLRTTGLDAAGSDIATARLLDFVQMLPGTHGIDLRFAFAPGLDAIRAAAQQAASLLREYAAQQSQLSQRYEAEAIRGIDVAALRVEWAQASAKFWLLATLSRKKMAKALKSRARLLGTPDLDVDLPVLEVMASQAGKVVALDRDLRGVPGWAGLDTEVPRMLFTLKMAERVHSSLIALADTPEQLMRLRHVVQKLVDGNALLAPEGAFAMAVGRLAAGYQSLRDAAARFAELAGVAFDVDKQASELASNCDAILANEKELNAWCSWRRVRAEALVCGLQPLVDAIEAGTIGDGRIAKAFDVAYARWFAGWAIDAEPLLCRFVAREQQSDIDTYACVVDELSSLTSAYIRAKLSGCTPDKSDRVQSSGFGVLRHELQKQRRHKPVRKLVDEMGADFTTLAPCMLMSPLSIAQYLPAGSALFDLVIFDEASQIAPWDAVGAIARGSQVVIAGDPRQMPPTSFFNRGTEGDDDDTDEDLESILDECIAAGMPRRSLTWHYRSRHESLITFSNYEYYGGGLVTFPASDTRPSVVAWRKVDGLYAQGKGGRRNSIEAQAIVAEVVRRLTDPVFIASGQSIGIITLNAEQQQLVNDLLDQARREHPQIEPHFKDDLTEPVVVKNLETVQGDERDLVLLGVAYGPTVPGAATMSMNFGPLNRDGGWRRLNVAVTRARREMMVFTSFDPSMIDLNRTSARAVKDLRHFIEFAERGPSAIAAAVRGSVGGYDSPFEQYVAEGLQAKGWTTHSQVGVSRFRIDLGVVHPSRPGDYLLGVECDGATYHSAATARDRDKVRGEILRGLGWRLLRVWSTEWWLDREGALKRLDAAIRAELERDMESAKNTEVVAMPEEVPQAPTTGIVATSTNHDADEATSEALITRAAGHEKTVSTRHVYRVTDLSGLAASLRPDSFQDAAYDAVLEQCIREVLSQEAPILDKLLVERIARAHGFKRSGRLIRERVIELAERRWHFASEPASGQGRFVWRAASDPAGWGIYRVPELEADARTIEELAPEEILAAAATIHGVDRVTRIARIFGIQRLSSAAKDRLARILEMSVPSSHSVVE